MLSVFSAFGVIPLILKYPHDHGAWEANIYNLTAIAAFWILASVLASPHRVENAKALPS